MRMQEKQKAQKMKKKMCFPRKKSVKRGGAAATCFFFHFSSTRFGLSLSLSLSRAPDKKAEEREGEGILYRTVAVFVPHTHAHT